MTILHHLSALERIIFDHVETISSRIDFSIDTSRIDTFQKRNFLECFGAANENHENFRKQRGKPSRIQLGNISDFNTDKTHFPRDAKETNGIGLQTEYEGWRAAGLQGRETRIARGSDPTVAVVVVGRFASDRQ